MFHQQTSKATEVVSIGLGQVGSLVLGVDGQGKERHGGVMVVKNHPRPASLSASFQGSAQFTHASGPSNQITGQRVTREIIDQQGALPLIHHSPRGSQKLGRLNETNGNWLTHDRD
jgi:hypothetical protein